MGFVYPPLYFWVSAAVSAVTGDALVAARWVSLVATVSSAGLIAAFVWRETANYVWAVLGAAFFLTTYELGGKWFHLARVDNLYFALLLGALFALRFARSGNGAVAAGAQCASEGCPKGGRAVESLLSQRRDHVSRRSLHPSRGALREQLARRTTGDS